ncbi:MAG: adenylate/guanylate cyclase domain-containing protein, partial [Nocardioides sp.]
LEPVDVAAMMLASLIPAVYATVLSYSIGELLARPLIEEIAAELPDDFTFEARGLPVAKRLRISIPAYTTCAGIAVVGLVDGGGGADQLTLAVVVALVVGLLLSHELTVLLASSITDPIDDVRTQLAQVRAGDYGARAAVLSSDELGELALDFNRMASGLAEREELRDAFSTYVDKEVVGLILSGRFPQEGIEVDVSLLFCDVRGFTAYAEQAAATEVIATLNGLFSEIVPVIEAHGGHVDKFLGDGVLAVFGAPEFLPDHADRAVDAARMIVDAVALGDSGLRVGVGVNSGSVVAGPLGGAGRLNFSVIGDAVNVASRVEAATRETGDDVLITAATRSALVRAQPLVARGSIPLKGRSVETELFALAGRDDAAGEAAHHELGGVEAG